MNKNKKTVRSMVGLSTDDDMFVGSLSNEKDRRDMRMSGKNQKDKDRYNRGF